MNSMSEPEPSSDTSSLFPNKALPKMPQIPPRLGVLTEEIHYLIYQMISSSGLPLKMQRSLSEHLQISLSEVESVAERLNMIQRIRRLIRGYNIEKRGRFQILKSLEQCNPTSMLFIVQVLRTYKGNPRGLIDFVDTYVGEDFDYQSTSLISMDAGFRIENQYLRFILQNYPKDELGSIEEGQLANSFEAVQGISNVLWTIRKWLLDKVES